jgi:hypothetical protein
LVAAVRLIAVESDELVAEKALDSGGLLRVQWM